MQIYRTAAPTLSSSKTLTLTQLFRTTTARSSALTNGAPMRFSTSTPFPSRNCILSMNLTLSRGLSITLTRTLANEARALLCLVYCATYAYSIASSPCNPPAPRTLHSIPHSGTSPMHMCIPLLQRIITSTQYDPYTCTPQQAHALYHQLQSHMCCAICIPKGAPGTTALRTRCNAARHVFMYIHTTRLCIRVA